MSRVDLTSVQSNLLNAFGSLKAHFLSGGHTAETLHSLLSRLPDEWEREQSRPCLFVGVGRRNTR